MRLYAIHAPRAVEAVAGPEGARAAKLGFSVAALVFGPLWLLLRAAWWALLAYVVAAAVVVALTVFHVVGPGVAAALCLVGQVFLGFEGRALALRARERGGRSLVDVIYADSTLGAEKIYLERALVSAPPAARRGAPPASTDVIGLFPEPGR